LPRRQVYLSVLLSPHEPYRSQRFLQFFYCNVRIRCRGDMFTYPFYCPHTNRTEVTASCSSAVIVRIRWRGDMFTCLLYCPHMIHTEVTVSYSSSTIMCVYFAAEKCLPIRFIAPHEPYRSHGFLFFCCKCAYTLARRHVYLSVLFSLHEPYRSHHFLQFFYSNVLIRCSGVKVKVTLRLTVSQSVSLGVKPHLGLMTRY
jgi:hypothetical protein